MRLHSGWVREEKNNNEKRRRGRTNRQGHRQTYWYLRKTSCIGIQPTIPVPYRTPASIGRYYITPTNWIGLIWASCRRRCHQHSMATHASFPHGLIQQQQQQQQQHLQHLQQQQIGGQLDAGHPNPPFAAPQAGSGPGPGPLSINYDVDLDGLNYDGYFAGLHTQNPSFASPGEVLRPLTITRPSAASTPTGAICIALPRLLCTSLLSILISFLSLSLSLSLSHSLAFGVHTSGNRRQPRTDRTFG